MTRGFNIDLSRESNLSSYYHTYWIEGEPTYNESLFGGKMDSLDISGRRGYYIRALRCERCGYLENYAI